MAGDGLDVVDLVWQIEDRFRITVGENEGEGIRTVGDLYAFLLRKISRGQEQVCVTSMTFHRLRRALMELFGVPRAQVRTATRLEDLVPARGRRRHWQRLAAWLGEGSLPPLRRPPWLVRSLAFAVWIGLVLPVCCAVALHELGYPAALCWALGGGGVLLGVLRGWAGYRLTLPWAVYVPPGCTTVRDTVYTLIRRDPAPLVLGEVRVCDAEVWGTLCAIVAATLDVRPGTLTPTTRLF
jgi:hypothetical protein